MFAQIPIFQTPCIIYLQTSTIQALAGNNFFKLGLYNARCMILAFRFVPPHREGRGKFDIHQAAANDSGRVVQEALKMFFMDNMEKTKLRLSSRELISYMKKVISQCRPNITTDKTTVSRMFSVV